VRRLAVALALAAVSCRGGAPEASASRSAAPPTPASRALAPAAATDEAAPEAAGVRYVEIVTAGASPEAALPMIVAIHGLGDDPDGFSDLLADFSAPARLVLPQAPDAYDGGGYSWFPVLARDRDEPALARGIGRAASRLAAAVRELRQRRPTVGRPIVTGFSQGGMLAFALAVSHPDLFSAAYPVGGWLPPPLWPSDVDDPAAYPPIVALHGDADPAVGFQPTRDAVEHLRGLGLSATLHAYPGVEHAITPDMRRDLHALLREAHRRATEAPGP
jgi:phospholipase/carboxylesterase